MTKSRNLYTCNEANRRMKINIYCVYSGLRLTRETIDNYSKFFVFDMNKGCSSWLFLHEVIYVCAMFYVNFESHGM